MSNPIRSWLFVPADSQKKLDKAGGLGADALILDLEDAVLPNNKPTARHMAADYLKTANTRSQIWVRINPLDSSFWRDDLQAVIPHQPAGIVLPKPDGPVDMETLGEAIDHLERKHNLPPRQIKTLPVATETARAVFSLPMYAKTYLPRLLGLSWGAEDLATDLGAATNKDENGEFAFVYKMVRAQTLLAAKAANVQAIDTLYDNFRDMDGLKDRALRAYQEGFTGMLAIHPAQIDIINQGFTPSAEQIAHARAIIKAFADNPEAGAVAVNGKMADMPHLKQAQNIYSAAKAFGLV
ncbi:MAG TPA: CoA ester lyase [Hellea balneolensis]|uniref:CoA ester lyase n=1 Tax=Hellea balneolensis TaxID=287478 RepID=A0A7C5R7X0_9PROT|nr:CoA ester lyase [Hellea balneolensis]